MGRAVAPGSWLDKPQTSQREKALPPLLKTESLLRGGFKKDVISEGLQLSDDRFVEILEQTNWDYSATKKCLQVRCLLMSIGF